MKKLLSYEIRQMWLDFWASKGHSVVPSASLVPVNDPTLLWINAGVAPLKKYFDGREVPENRRLTNAQKAIRTNDIDNVGKTARHHTFFEMLGNFSIGDYFRTEALTWAYELLTSPKYFDFDINKLYFTIYPDDVESFNLWKKLGVKEDHIVKLEGNFWEIGEGPCGPDTEIFFDRGEKYDPNHLGDKMLREDIENDRYIEIWNIVFSQYNSKIGVERSNYEELPSKNIDTGSGLERLACVMQEVETNYDTDLFMPIIRETEKISGVKYTGQMAFKVIADHVRSVTFAVSDGAMLSNEGRGYVLRRILRRAVRYGKVLGIKDAFLYKLVDVVCDYMSNFYPYLLDTKKMVSDVVKREEVKFLSTLENGEKKLVDYINSSKSNVVSGDFAFLLYDTFGFPIELTEEVAAEYKFTVDINGFKEELAKQKKLARDARRDEQSMNVQNEDMLNFKEDSKFVGYEKLECRAHINGIFKDGNISSIAKGKVILAFDETPFYATSGGQIGDKGLVTIKCKTFNVLDSFKLPNGQHAVTVDIDVDAELGDEVILAVDKIERAKIASNHSATHLVNEALRQVLGKHVSQQGSSVNGEFLRFDFNNFNNLTDDELLKVEKIVNSEISKKEDTHITEMALDDAKKLGVQAVFGEKYGSVVRVVEIGFSKELCGGTHVSNTGDIKKLAVLSCESKGSGIFRIECATGDDLAKAIKENLKSVEKEIEELKAKENEILENSKKDGITLNFKQVESKPLTESYEAIIDKKMELARLREEVKELDKEYNKLKRNTNLIDIKDFIPNVKMVKDVNTLLFKVSDVDSDSFKDLVDRLSDNLNNSLIFGANIAGGKVLFVCKSKVKALMAGSLVKLAASITLGGGGGRPDFAQAGGKDITKVDEALTKVSEEIEKLL